MAYLISTLLILFGISSAYAQSEQAELTSLLSELETINNNLQMPVNCDHSTNVPAINPEDFHKYVELSQYDKRQAQYDGINVSVLSEEDAKKLFAELAAIDYMPYKYMDDGCYARAHEYALIAARYGIEMGKVFAEDPSGELLYPQRFILSEEKPFFNSFAGWNYHVAPFVLVEKEGELTPMIFDIGTQEKAQDLNEWKSGLSHDSKNLTTQVRHRDFIYQDSSFQEKGSIIPSQLETQNLIEELGEAEYLFRLDQGWL